MANQGRTSVRTAGDFTGREKARLAKEQAKQIQERQAETTLVNQEERDAEEHGVFDPRTGARTDLEEVQVIGLEDDEVEEIDNSRPFGGGFFPEEDDEPVLTGHESEEDLAPILAARNVPKVPSRTPRAHSATVVIRLDTDIDDMTYGMDPISQTPNNYTFKEGLKYEVTFDLAEHLNGLGVIRQWVRT